jgi:hypothetical protein
MITFEIFLNGKKLFTAGGEYQTVITSLTRVRIAPDEHALIFNTSGIEAEPLTIAHWPDCDIRVGDRIEIRVVEASHADPPVRLEHNTGEGSEN